MSEVRVYDAPSGLAGKWVRESDVKALRDERDRLREALERIEMWGKCACVKEAKAAVTPAGGGQDE